MVYFCKDHFLNVVTVVYFCKDHFLNVVTVVYFCKDHFLNVEGNKMFVYALSEDIIHPFSIHSKVKELS